LGLLYTVLVDTYQAPPKVLVDGLWPITDEVIVFFLEPLLLLLDSDTTVGRSRMLLSPVECHLAAPPCSS
jgi:hypothetical protein